jgi:hypothetical protein
MFVSWVLGLSKAESPDGAHEVWGLRSGFFGRDSGFSESRVQGFEFSDCRVGFRVMEFRVQELEFRV